MSSTAHWIGNPARPALAWLDLPVAGVGPAGVVVCPPAGYEYWSTHHTLRMLGEMLAKTGTCTLRLDYTGTGDAAGDPTEADQWQRWAEDLAAAVAHLRDLGCIDVSLVGVRLGAMLALCHAGALGIRTVVTWDAVRSGRRYGRELRMLGLELPDHSGLSIGGAVLSARTLDQIAHLGPETITGQSVARVLLVDRSEVAPDPLAERLRQLGMAVDASVVPSAAAPLDQPTEYATVSWPLVDTIVGWLNQSSDPPPAVRPIGISQTSRPDRDPASQRVARFQWTGGTVAEDVVSLGKDRLVAIRTRPVDLPQRRRPVLVWLNSGSEHHVGPGRAWVEFARDLALSGWTSLRVDFRGWGETPGAGEEPGRPYDASGVEQTGRLLTQLSAERTGPATDPIEPGPVVLIGLCAGAWVAVSAAVTSGRPPFGLVALDPQLYWRPGDPVEANLETETHTRRLPEIRRWQRMNRLGVWSFLDRLHITHPAATDLRRLQRTGTNVLWVFADGDDGLDFLQNRIGRAWRELRRSPRTRFVVLPGLDHSMRRTWERHRLLATLTSWLEAVEPDGVNNPSGI